MDEKNLREIIEFEISVLVGTKECNYDYSEFFCDFIYYLITVI